MIIFRQKEYAMYDQTDRLKQMKDSDILAEQKRPTSASDNTSLAKAALAGGTIAGIGAGVMNGRVFKTGAGIKGAIAGAGLAAGYNIYKNMTRSKEEKQRYKDNEFYNRRLEYAQRQARRREAADWKNNMVNRTGYTY